MLSPSLAFRWNYAEVGDLGAHADVANAHMYPGGHRPSNQIGRITQAVQESIPGKPLVTTEAGYHNALATTGTHGPVPEDVAGAYLPRLLLEHVLRGEQRMYSYELIDSFDDPGRHQRGGALRPAQPRPDTEAGVHRDEVAARAARRPRPGVRPGLAGGHRRRPARRTRATC